MITNILSNIHNFDITESNETNDKIIDDICYYLSDYLCLDKQKFNNFICLLKKCYKDNKYHNFNHAVDATISLLFLIDQTKLEFTNIEISALIISMLSHDIGHFERTGNFIKNFIPEMVEEYGESSTLESYHFHNAKKIIIQSELLSGIDFYDKLDFFSLLKNLILATDPNTNKDFLINFSPSNRIEILQLLVKCADIGSVFKNFDIHKKWALKLINEFYHEGDIMKNEYPAYQILPIFNRDYQHLIPNQQNEFFLFCVFPLFTILDQFFKNNKIIDFIKDNRNEWLNLTK